MTVGLDKGTTWYLHDVDTEERLRAATPEEVAASDEASKHDGGVGMIVVDGRYVRTQVGASSWRRE